jgi:CelD/BcsL family acetyltransferase involved in cellulose biosynthesis
MQFSTPYQRFDLLGQWQLQVGARENGTPLIVIAYDGERRPLVLMPMTLRREHGVRVARFMGGKHTTFNMPHRDRRLRQER